MKILQILNSDFGSPNTMGYRSYQIYKNNSDLYIGVFCRENLSELSEKKIKRPFPFYREYSRFSQFARMINKNITIFKSIERKIFDKLAKRIIDNYDIIHFFHHSKDLISYAKSRKKIVLVEGFTHPLYIKKMFDEGIKLDYDFYTMDENSIKSYELADFIISPSTWVTKTLLYAGIEKNKIIQIEYGVHQQEDRKYIRDNVLKIAFAGGLKRTKGIVELLKAANLLRDYNIEVNIYGRLYNDIKSEIKKFKNDNVKFHGFVKDMIKEYKKNDIYVYPTYFEGSSKTVFEAMSCGLPVITTENAGSIVRDGIDGFIVPVNSVNDLVEKIKYFYENREQIEIMGRNAQKYSRKFTWERYAKRIIEFYKKVMRNET